MHLATDSSRPRRPIPGYFFPLLSGEDAAEPAGLRGMLEAVRAPTSARLPTLVYVHVPFCRSQCSFCGFYRRTIRKGDDRLGSYVDSVLRELDAWQATRVLESARVEAVYIGGGSPSLLGPELAGRLLGGLRGGLGLAEGTELSFEGEVSTLKDEHLLETLREHRVTRCSFGVQSFDPGVRRLSSILATLADVEACMAALRRSGYPLCLDLMYGLPGQSVATFQQDLRRAVDLEGAAMVDLYPTVLYPNAPLFQQDRSARAELPGPSEREQMYAAALDLFADRGLYQFTFEDFCRPGAEYSMKRLTYGSWDGRAQTLALGACAVGYVGQHAYRNQVLERYGRASPSGLSVALLRQADLDEQRRRALFFYPRRLRLEPLRLPIPLTDEQEGELGRQVAAGLAERRSDGSLTLTRLGRTRADELALGWLTADERRKLFRLVQ